MSIPENLQISYYVNGKVMIAKEMSGKMMHGICVSWNVNGTIDTELNYLDGWPEGPYRMWYANGSIAESSFFVKGELHGIVYEWNEDGSLCSEFTYHFGQMHGKAVVYHHSDQGSEREVFIYCNDEEITEEVELIVNDIDNITDTEKTQIAVQFGLLL